MTITRPRLALAGLMLPCALLIGAIPGRAALPTSPTAVRWKKTILDTKFRAEGACVADVNRDGKNDILAGEFWYEAPEWTPRQLYPTQEYVGATGYSQCFLTFAMDVDGDGWTDQVVIDFPGKPAVWRRNPGKSAAGYWEQFPICESACNESPIFADVDGDGKPELVTPFQEKQMAYYKPGKDPRHGWERHLVGAPDQPGVKRFSHGLGVGDVNGDKRADIITTDGYYQAPADRAHTPWTFVPAKLGPACAQMYACDFNGDGLPDVISSSAHQIGVWWYEQSRGANGEPRFQQHLIDDFNSQSHSLMPADINGDGQVDFVTGKRWWAHGPNGDVNPNDPAVLNWYEFKRAGSSVEWSRHAIDADSGVGTQFTVARVNKDRRPDVVIGNKRGVFLFEQVR